MYDDENRAAEVDLTDVDEVEELVRSTAKTICAEQPDMPEPQSLSDMDSFSVVQMLLEIENTSGRKLLEKFESYAYGEEFRDLAEHIVAIVTWENANPDWDPNSEEEYNPGGADAPEEMPDAGDGPKTDAAPSNGGSTADETPKTVFGDASIPA
jgi:hypothetical protein